MGTAGCVDTQREGHGTLISFGMDAVRAGSGARRVGSGGALDGRDLISLWAVVKVLRAASRDLERTWRPDVDRSTRAKVDALWGFMTQRKADGGDPAEVVGAIEEFAGALTSLALSPTRGRGTETAERLSELSSYVLRVTGSSGETVVRL
jgi:hypothetical protein